MLVVVAGAGPVGLMLAGELRLAGVDVVVLERRTDPTGQARGVVMHARTREVLDQRGLLPRFGDVPGRPTWHFGALPTPLDFGRLDGPHGGVAFVPQARTEQVLAAWAVELGATIRRGHAVASVSQDEEGVDVEVRGPDGPYRLRAAYLAGCDGARSVVRKAAGFTFETGGSGAENLVADVVGLDLPPQPFTWTPAGMFAVMTLGDGALRLVVHEHGRVAPEEPEPPAFEEVRAAFERVTGQDVRGATPRWLSRFGDRSGQATRYRIGRVLLAGDAAHVHYPGGGQGLNLGVQDAVNLGWKLAAEVQGRAPADLLDTYEVERHPVGRQVVVNAEAQALLMLGGPEVGPLRELLADLMRFEGVNDYLVGRVSALDVRYDVGGGDHRLLGRRMPHTELACAGGPTSTTRLLHRARGVLLDLGDDSALREGAAGWADRVNVVAARAAGPGALDGVQAVLLRPDGHVAWLAPGPAGPEPALRRWFGAPG